MRVSIGDTRLFFDVEGAKFVPDGPVLRERPTILLLHGGPGFDHSSYKPAYSTLSTLGQVIYLDHRGHGRSDPAPAAQMNLAQLADDAAAFCRVLGIENPVVYGLSFGGFVAQALAVRHPDLSPKIILDSTVPKIRLDMAFDAFERLGGKEMRGMAERFWTRPDDLAARETYMTKCLPAYSRTAQDPAGIQRAILKLELVDVFFGAGGEGHSFDFREDLARSKARFLVLSGKHDPITPPEAAAAFRDALPPEQLRFVSFDDSGHGIFRDSPEAAFGEIERFILS
ncbi:MAG TPA: alpha/beta hydrolase [Rhizomicrobium sp.]